MGILEDNMQVLQTDRPDLYKVYQNGIEMTENIMVAEAANGEKILLVEDGERVLPFASTYDPSHEADRFVAQYEENKTDSRIFVYGFGDGRILRRILDKKCPIQFCIVYEPSKEMFYKILENYDIRDILHNGDIAIAVHDANDNDFEQFLSEIVNYKTWRTYSFISLYRYDICYEDTYKWVADKYIKTMERKEADMNTLITFAESGMENEIKALKWMIDCQVFEDFIGKFPTDIPCIIVAAGPSLSKNVEMLRQAKNRAFILCVDTAIHYLLDRDIFPDMICTIDSKKGPTYFTDPRTCEIPIAVALQSDYHALETIGDVKPIYLSAENEYYHKLFDEKGKDMIWFDGGGSVATVCFHMALKLGFKTIVLIGQDLAYTGNMSHAGKELVESDYVYKTMMVEGYYGDQVLTRADYKSYIDWYEMMISGIKDATIINATEGGAKIRGAVQMSLQEVVDTYCKKEYDIGAIIDAVPRVWDTYEDKEKYYHEIKNKLYDFKSDLVKLKEGVRSAERAITLIQRKNYDVRELNKHEKVMGKVTDYMMQSDEALILVRRVIELDLKVAYELHDSEDELDKESLRLYKNVHEYYSRLIDAIKELLPIWEQTVNDINKKYCFE